jgi:hypothetical protein
MMDMAIEDESVRGRQEHLRGVLLEAERRGFPIHRKEGEPEGIANGAPGLRSLVADLMVEWNLGNVATPLYAFMSGYAHSEVWVLLEQWDIESSAESAGVQPVVKVGDLERSVRFAMYGFVSMCDRYFPYCGWDVDDWHRWARHAVDRLRG